LAAIPGVQVQAEICGLAIPKGRGTAAKSQEGAVTAGAAPALSECHPAIANSAARFYW